MIETTIPKIDVTQLMARVREEAETNYAWPKVEAQYLKLTEGFWK